MIISVKVKTGVKIEKVTKLANGYEVKIRSRPVHGAANQRTIELLSDFFGLSKRLIKIKSGLKSKNKIIELID